LPGGGNCRAHSSHAAADHAEIGVMGNCFHIFIPFLLLRLFNNSFIPVGLFSLKYSFWVGLLFSILILFQV
jgi:hypothetical protein